MLLQCHHVIRQTDPVELRIVGVHLHFKTMLLNQVHQVSCVNYKKMGPTTEPCGMPQTSWIVEQTTDGT
jgi:hypothetical protein